MVNFIKIEWSGYWDFPVGDYQSGEKAGQPITGEFPEDHIILDQAGSVEYEIDPSKDTFPKSPGWDFTLINKDPASGVELYPSNEITKLGRPPDQGGHDNKFYDLFIKATVPILNDKVIFKGVVEDFGYSLHEREIRFNCTDFIGSLKNKNKKIFLPFQNDNLELEVQNRNHQEILEEFTKVSDTSVPIVDADSPEKQLTFQKFILKKPEVKYFSPKPVLGTFLPQVKVRLNLDRSPENGSWVLDSEANAVLKDLFDKELDGMLRRVFLDNFDDFIWIKSAVKSSTANGFLLTVNWELPIRNTFVQLGISTVFNPFFITMEAKLFWNSRTTLPEEYRVKFDIQFPSMNNGNLETTFNDEKLVVFERGKYFKDEVDPEAAEFKTGDIVSVTFHDYKVYENDPDDFGVGVGWEKFSQVEKADVTGRFVQAEDDVNLCGFMFMALSNEVRAGSVPGRKATFDNIESFVKNVQPNLVKDFTFTEGGSLIFDETRLANLTSAGETNRNCFISDVQHYGWIGNKIEDVIVNNARQVSAFLFAVEDGSIRYQSRLYHFFSDRIEANGFYRLEPEYVKPESGKDFSFGDKFFKIEFADIIEVNNLKSEDNIERVVDVNGVVNKFVNPTDLKVSNYRTSDLGVPDSRTLAKPATTGSHFILRIPIGGVSSAPLANLMLKTAEDQATDFARSIRFPTEVFDVSVDVLKNPSLNYDKIGIGDYFLLDDGTGVDYIYLVRKISYNPNDLLTKSASVRMNLLLVAKSDEFLFEGSIEIIQGSGGDVSGTAASATNFVIKSPSQSSDSCGGTGSNRVFIRWKSVDYCIEIPVGSIDTIASIVVNQINNNVPGLSAINLGAGEIAYVSDNQDSTDNNESITWLIPSAIEGDGNIFDNNSFQLSGGEDPSLFNPEAIRTIIGSELVSFGVVLSSDSDTIQKNETSEQVAQKIFNGLDSVVQSDYEFSLSGNKITVGSNRISEDSIDVDVKQTGVAVDIENIIFKQTT